MSTSAVVGSSSRICIIVTGASRGLGRAIATTFCRVFAGAQQPTISSTSVHAVLVARSSAGLQTTADDILLQFESSKKNNDNNSVTVSQVVADLSDMSTLDATCDRIFDACTTASQEGLYPFHRLVFINNAGSLGCLGPGLSTPSLAALQREIDLNVTSALWMSVRVGRWAATQPSTQGRNGALMSKTTIVNISSLCAVQPTPTMAMYSAGKAARDSYHTALAAECNANSGSDTMIRILNYAPGPLETDMATTLRQTTTLDATLQPHFHKTLVDPMDSALVLCKLLQEDTYTSGSHIDYYDCIADHQS